MPYELWTYRDAIDHVLESYKLIDTGVNLRNARRAVLEAYRQLPSDRNWNYFYRRGKIVTVASQATSTVAYDHTGGTYERMLTIAAGTWPTDIKYYEIIINRVRYEVDARKTSTIITLTAAANPGADVSAGTAYTAVRDIYPMPEDFFRMGQLVDVANGSGVLTKLSVDDLLTLNRSQLTTTNPYAYAITKGPEYPGGTAIQFGPSPASARTYDFAYVAKPRALVTDLYNTGTVSVSADGTAITGTSTVFVAAHIGAVMRFSSSTTAAVTSPVGGITGDYNPPIFQRTVEAFTSGTALTVNEGADSALSGVKYTLSDRLDIESGSMLNYFLRLCEACYARIEGRPDRMTREVAAREAFNLAAWGDTRSFEIMSAAGGDSGNRLSLAGVAGTVNGVP